MHLYYSGVCGPVSATEIIQIIGGLAVFLYGMKTMSESLQDVAGNRLKSLLAKMTTNRVTGMLSGMLITVMVQSSSATTVMLVGFVNAGLVTLIQAVGVVMGANIGTTITAWLVSLLGFKVNIASFALPAIAIGVAFQFSQRQNFIGWGRVLIGFGLLFLGLMYLKDAVPDAAKNPEAFAFLQQFTGHGILTVLQFILIGTILTVVVQSSSAATTITLTLAFTGYIPIDAAYGMILGENIGTTITANIAALAGNTNSKKTAIAHTLFNMTGVVWVMILFYPFVTMIDYMVPGDPMTDMEITRFHISAFHTTFNILNTMILIWFVPQIAKSASRFIDFIIKPKDEVEDAFKLLEAGTIQTSRLSVLELASYIEHILKDTYDGLKLSSKLIKKGYDSRISYEILENEKNLDFFRTQMMRYLAQIQEQGVSGASGIAVIRMLERVRRLEEIGDQHARIARKLRVADRDDIILTKDHRDNLKSVLKNVEEHFQDIIQNTDKLNEPGLLQKSKVHHEKIEKQLHMLESSIRKSKKLKKTKIMPTIIVLDVAHYLTQVSHHLHGILEVAHRVEEEL